MVHHPTAMIVHFNFQDDNEDEEINNDTKKQPKVILMAQNRSMASMTTRLQMCRGLKHKSLYKINSLIVISLIFAISAFLVHLYVPTYLENAILQEFILDPNSSSYPGWQKSNIPIYGYYYLFNITNADQLFQSGIKPIIEEVGPYVFQQIFEKVNITWDSNNGTVQYKQIKRWIFAPEKTNGSLDDVITHINVPLMTAIHQIGLTPKEETFLVYESINSLIDALTIQVFMKHKVRDLLFEGYEDDLLTTVSSFYPDQVTHTRFGWLFQKNNTSTDGLFRIFTGKYNFGRNLGLIDTWNNEKVNIKWSKGDKCRSLNNTTTGDLQPPFFLQQNYSLLEYFISEDRKKPLSTISMFIADMCRTFDLQFKEKIYSDKLPKYRYQMDPNNLNYTYKENQCYCKKSCPPNGLFDLGVCAQDSPIFTSSPHFLFGDPSLRENVIGLKPDYSKHQFIMDFDQKFGIATDVQVKFQLNILIKKNNDIEIMADWPEDLQLYLPQFWFATHAIVDESITSQLYFINVILPLILFLMTILIALMSIICVIYLCFYIWNSHMSWTFDEVQKCETVSMLETKSDCTDSK